MLILSMIYFHCPEAMDLFIDFGLRGVLAVTLALFHMQQRRLIAAKAMEHVRLGRYIE